MFVHVHFIVSYSVSVSKCSHMTHLACALRTALVCVPCIISRHRLTCIIQMSSNKSGPRTIWWTWCSSIIAHNCDTCLQPKEHQWQPTTHKHSHKEDTQNQINKISNESSNWISICEYVYVYLIPFKKRHQMKYHRCLIIGRKIYLIGIKW